MILVNQLGLLVQCLQASLVQLFVNTFQSLVIIGTHKTNQWIPLKTLFLMKYRYHIVVDVLALKYLLIYFIFVILQKSFLNVDDSRKKYVLKVAGKLHRCFRSFLTKNHLKHVDGTFKDCPQLYEGLISPEEWTAFTAKRKTEKFQVRLINLQVCICFMIYLNTMF